jgi:hypothetical protein
MRFEHLVQINDPLQPLATEVSREQLRRGLVRRAERPAEFVLGLAGSSMRMARRLREQVYRSADVDTVRRIRDLAERGELG